MLPFASAFLRSLRGDEILVECHLLSAAREWRRLVPVADVVFADVLAADVMRRARARRLREFRFLKDDVIERLRKALGTVAPRTASPRRG